MAVTNVTKTLCPYCGVGCGLEVVSPADPSPDLPSANPRVYKVRGDRTHPSSQGMVCVKGATVAEAMDRDRLLYPMMRDRLDQPLRRVSWEQAWERIVDRMRSLYQSGRADAICMYGSGQLQTEDYYVAQKLLKGCLGTNNFDTNSRLCMSSAVSGYLKSLGSDGPPCCYADLEVTDCALFIGSNAAECHPIAFNRFRKHHKQNPGVKLMVVDPRRTPTAEVADLHLAIRPGTDIDLLNGIAHLLLRWGAIAPQFIDHHTRGFAEYAEVLSFYTPEWVAERCGIAQEALVSAATIWRDSRRVLTLWSMGVNQSAEGTAKVRSIINLHLMTGQMGQPGSGPFSLTGQPNAMGGREVGGLSHLLPGYRFIADPAHRAEVEQFWGLPPGRIAPTPGRSAWDMIQGLESGDVEVLWIAATNPAVSLPDLDRVKAALMRSPLTIYQEAYHPTETADYAHILLPAAPWGEKTGTMTNSERVVTLARAVRPPVGEARADWEIFAEVGRRLGFAEQFQFADAAAVRAELVQLTRDRPCDQTGITHATLERYGPLQWPCSQAEMASCTPAPAPTRRLYGDGRFATPDGRARFLAYHSRGLAEPPDDRYPFVFTNGRLYGHWHTQTRTGRIAKIRQMHPAPFLEIHPRDAENLGVAEGDWVAVRSPRGMAQFPVVVTRAIAPGVVYAPMHWGRLWAEQSEVNALTHAIACPESLEPELKACAVQVIPLSIQTPAATPALTLSGVESSGCAGI